jgi:AcrR family transcriptional regulator
MRRLAGLLGFTQPVLYTAFESRQALIDAVALRGFSDLVLAFEGVDATPMPRMRAYLDFATSHPRVYEAMFSLPSALGFASQDTPEPLREAFQGIREVFPAADDARAEVGWSLLHGLATLEASGRLRTGYAQARLELAGHALIHTSDANQDELTARSRTD